MAEAATDGRGAAFDFQLYRYTPSLPAAVVSAVVFAALTLLHAWRLHRARAYYFTAFTIGGLCKSFQYIYQAQCCSIANLCFTTVQTIGYCGRIWGHFDKFTLGGFIIQAILILLAPALYAASIYMILGRLIRTVRAEHLSLIPVRWVTRVFVAGDVLAFTLQAGGGGIQAGKTLEMFHLGEKIIIVGLFFQICIFGFFVITSILFHRRLAASQASAPTLSTIPWSRYLWVLYITSAIILVRSIFRVVEYLQGNSGYLISHEIFLYIFDTVLMAIVMAIFLVWYVDQLEGKLKLDKEDSPTSSEELVEM